KRIARGTVSGKKIFRRFARDQQLAEFGENDRPAEQRQDQQRDDGDFAFGGGVLDGEHRCVGKQGMNDKRGHREWFGFWVSVKVLGGNTTVTRPVLFASAILSFLFLSPSVVSAEATILVESSACMLWLAALAAVPWPKEEPPPLASWER